MLLQNRAFEIRFEILRSCFGVDEMHASNDRVSFNWCWKSWQYSALIWHVHKNRRRYLYVWFNLFFSEHDARFLMYITFVTQTPWLYPFALYGMGSTTYMCVHKRVDWDGRQWRKCCSVDVHVLLGGRLRGAETVGLMSRYVYAYLG